MSFSLATLWIGMTSMGAPPPILSKSISADANLPTKTYPLFIKVGCLTRDYQARGAKSLEELKKSKNDGDLTDYTMLTRGKDWKYTFLSSSPDEFVLRLQEAVSKEQAHHAASDENPGKFNVRCVVKLLVLEGHTGAGIGGSPSNFEPFAKEGAKFGGLTAKQIESVQDLMADDATIYWVACKSMYPNGTARALQKVLAKNGGAFVGFKDTCWADSSFPNELQSDESLPVAVRIPPGAQAAELDRLFNLCGQRVKGGTEYYVDNRFPGKTLRPWCWWSWFPEDLRIRLILGQVHESPALKR